MLNGTNFKSWKENVLIVLGVMDFDLALRVDQPDPLTHESTSDQKSEMEKWERSNRMSLMIMKHAIPEAFRGTMSEQITTAKGFLEDVEKRFAKNEKAETSTLLAKLICHAPRGARLDWDSLLAFSDIGVPKSYNCINISYAKIQNKTTTVVVFTVSYTSSPESHLHIQKLHIYIYTSERGTYCDEPLLVCWPSCMREITNVLLCTYTDLKPVLSFTLSEKHMSFAHKHL